MLTVVSVFFPRQTPPVPFAHQSFEHVSDHQKDRVDLFIRTIGIERARATIGLANIAHNMGRLIFNERRASTA